MFIKLTRLYKNEGSTVVKSQSITVNSNAVAVVRPVNKLAGQHTAIVLTSGTEYALAERFSAVNSLLDGAVGYDD